MVFLSIDNFYIFIDSEGVQMMSSNRLPLSQTAFIAAATTLIVILAGCQSAPPPPERSGNHDPSAHAETAETADSPQKTYSEQNNRQTGDEPNTNVADLSNDANAAAAETDKPTGAKAIVETASEKASWSASAPKLHTLSIGQAAAAVFESFGDELDSYMLDEEGDRIQVLEYDGFAVGLNSRKTVQYVEVYGEHISPGLSGLTIGNKADAAVKLLGKPDKQTTYLLMYKAKGALLKLDLDPDNKKIISIKLLKA
jgi:hypothetical protein